MSSCIVGRDSSVGIATRYGLGGPGIESRWWRDFPPCPDRPWGPHSLLYNGYRVSFLPVQTDPGAHTVSYTMDTGSVSSLSRPTLGPTQSPIQWIPGLFPRCPDRPWGPHSLLYNGHRVCFLPVQTDPGAHTVSYTMGTGSLSRR